MQFKNTIAFTTFAALASQAMAGFDINSKDNLALYWGQASAGSQQSLGDYCDQTAGDIYILSFMNDFSSNSFGLNFGNACDSTTSCPNIGADIQKCQSQGKIVLLSLGGAVGQYGFSSDSDGEAFADILWNQFAGGSSDSRPFGDAQVDGFDLDIENNNNAGYAALVSKLKQYYNGANKPYYVSAAPQCVYPDANVGNALANSDIDFAFIQFYNNPCSLDKSFNWDTWQNFAENSSPNKNIKLFIGLPGASSAAGSGYVDPSTVQNAVNSASSSSNFGGIMLWDASQGFSNQVDGTTYADAMQNILNGVSGGSSSSGSSSSGSSSASPASSAAAASTTALNLVASQPAASGSTSTQADGGVVYVTHYVSQWVNVQETVTVNPPASSYTPPVVKRHQH